MAPPCHRRPGTGSGGRPLAHQYIGRGPGRISPSPCGLAAKRTDVGAGAASVEPKPLLPRDPSRFVGLARQAHTVRGRLVRPLGSAGVVPVACRTRHEMPGPTCRAAHGAVWFPCRGRRNPCFARWHASCGVMGRVLPVPPLRRSFACLCSAP
jgi:hypothetical protein